LVDVYPDLHELHRRFASLPIRNAGTLVGNLANGSPIGDSMPALIALGARIVLRREERLREIPLEDFYIAYQKTALQSGEFVQAVRVPLPAPGQRFRAYKLSKRYDQDISAVCAGFSLRLEGGIVRQARMGFGGLAATPRRAPKAEQALEGRPWNDESVARAMAALKEDFQPLSDMRASSAYRTTATQNLLYRCFLETREESPLAPRQTSVFAGAETG
jgi:xanthine dehydrogenase small subunit